MIQVLNLKIFKESKFIQVSNIDNKIINCPLAKNSILDKYAIGVWKIKRLKQ